MSETEPVTRVIPIGGAGEFGANSTIIQTAKTTILIDFGIMFPPDSKQPGVEFYINDPHLLLQQFPELSAIFITHAHEDHIGALGFLLKKKELPIFTMPYTAQMIEKHCSFFGIDPEIHLVELNKPELHGDLSVEFVGVTHSIAQACALCVKTPGGVVLHTGDFKVDPLPSDGHHFQSDRLRELGERGIDLLIMDSTNSFKKGFCPSDQEIVPFIEEQIRSASGRVFFTTFSSHMPRIKKLKQIARRTGRKIAMIGRGFEKHFEVSIDTRYMTRWPDVFATIEQAMKLPEDQVIYVATGSQAEQQSALARIARDGFKGVRAKAGDKVIFSSKSIPGNERALALMASDLERQGIEVVTEKMTHVHTSGHAYREDLAYMLALTQPRCVSPIHGEFLQLLSHYHWLRSLLEDHQDAILVEDGSIIVVSPETVTLDGVLETNLLPVDGGSNLPISKELIKARKDMMYSGLVLICADIQGPPEKNSYQVSTEGMVEKKQGAVASLILEFLEPLDYDLKQPIEAWVDAVYLVVKRAMKRILGSRPVIKIVMNGQIGR